MVTGQQIADFVGQGDAKFVAVADEVVPVITSLAKSYTRGHGFDETGEPNTEIAAVITTASARLAANPKGLLHQQRVDDVEAEFKSSFIGWTLAEQFTLNRYRKRAM